MTGPGIDPLAGLREALDAEFGPRPRVGSLATVDEAGSPRVRSVVCRRVEAGSIWVASDARSAKNRQVRARPDVELAFWLPGRREQFRIAGTAGFATEDDRSTAWSALSDAARALFVWPTPGSPRVDDPGAFPASVGADAPIPWTFEVLRIGPVEIEFLDLKAHPHRRTRRREAAGWEAEELNP